MDASLGKLAFRIEEAADLSGIGRTTLYAAIKSGDLTAHKCGRRTIVLFDDLRRYLNRLPTVARNQKRNNFGFGGNADG